MFSEDEHNSTNTDDEQCSTEENKALKEQVHDISDTGKPVAAAVAFERKREIKRFLISFGILLIYGALLYYLVPYAKHLSVETFEIAPTIILKEFLLPLFWLLLGWTIMKASSVLGLVEKRRAKAGRALYIVVVVLLVLYVAALLPFLIESIKCMALSSQYLKSTGSFSYSYQIPLAFQKLELAMIDFSNKSGVFIAVGVIFWLSKPEKRQKKA